MTENCSTRCRDHADPEECKQAMGHATMVKLKRN